MSFKYLDIIIRIVGGLFLEIKLVIVSIVCTHLIKAVFRKYSFELKAKKVRGTEKSVM